MKLRVLAALSAIAFAPAALLAAPPGADQFRLKPGAKGKVCLTCHADFEQTLKLPFVHTPVKSGQCSDCHNPHASTHGKLLAADASQICQRCHADVVPKEAKSVHKAALEGACVKCHDPHGAKNKDNLVAAGNELCFTCHQDIAKSAGGAQFKHSPVERSCLGCHDPHASKQADFLLTKASPELCLTCHKPDAPGFAKQHMNYPVTKADCTSCHDPHGSSNRGILWTSAHQPVVTKMCGQCHQDAASPTALETKREGWELCRGCHNAVVNDTLTKSHVHWPAVDDVACLNCHRPHAAKHAKLLSGDSKTLCGSCHSDTLRTLAKSKVKHSPAEAGDCTSCHAPHSSNTAFLLTANNVDELCGNCHDWQKHSMHPIGEKAVDPRNKNLTLDCLSCHVAHAGDQQQLANFEPKMDLCVQCHAELKR